LQEQVFAIFLRLSTFALTRLQLLTQPSPTFFNIFIISGFASGDVAFDTLSVQWVTQASGRITVVAVISRVLSSRTCCHQASAHQRRGRAGRCQRGFCWRLYPSFAHALMPEFNVPEMLRENNLPFPAHSHGSCAE
jgi:ATP-dependent RNA helicase DHX36